MFKMFRLFKCDVRGLFRWDDQECSKCSNCSNVITEGCSDGMMMFKMFKWDDQRRSDDH